MPEELLDNFDDEVVEDEFSDGFIVMTDEEFIEWCEGAEEGEPYGDC